MGGLSQPVSSVPLQPGNDIDEIVTLQTIRTALGNTVGSKGMPSDNLDRLAEYVMNFFGYSDYVIDNALSSEDRDVFYMLEEEGILTTAREEVSLLKGKLWRIHYWILKKRQIAVHAAPPVPETSVASEASIYDTIDETVWLR